MLRDVVKGPDLIMNASSWAGTLTAVFTLLTAVLVAYNTKATRKVDDRVASVETGVSEVQTGVGEVHQVVNSRLDQMLERQELMVAALAKAGLAIPPAVPAPVGDEVGPG
jgi:hypothetical protein